MFVNQHRRDRRDAGQKIQPKEGYTSGKQASRSDGQQVAQGGQSKRAGMPSRDGDAVQAGLAIGVVILAGVDDVEPGDPGEHGAAEHERRQQIGRMSETFSPRIAIQAATGEGRGTAPSQKWAQRCESLRVKL